MLIQQSQYNRQIIIGYIDDNQDPKQTIKILNRYEYHICQCFF